MQQGMASSISNATASMGLSTFAEFQTLTSEGTLIDFSIFCPTERHTCEKGIHDSSK